MLIALAMAGCSPNLLFNPLDTARELAAKSGWREVRLDGTYFTLAAFHSPNIARAETVHIYIEGDGRGWRGRTAPPRDPSPTNPLGFHLALADPAPGVLYLARPCQYVRGSELKNCDPAYWMTYRFAPEVIAATDKAIDSFLVSQPSTEVPRRLVMFGYSGGGDVAALIAVRRQDVVALVTVASPLDHAAWTRWHAVDPLSASLNPADFPELRRIPQVHFLGGRDETVPPAIVRPFIARQVGQGATVQTFEIPGHDHECCWAAIWKGLLGPLNLP